MEIAKILIPSRSIKMFDETVRPSRERTESNPTAQPRQLRSAALSVKPLDAIAVSIPTPTHEPRAQTPASVQTADTWPSEAVSSARRCCRRLVQHVESQRAHRFKRLLGK